MSYNNKKNNDYHPTLLLLLGLQTIFCTFRNLWMCPIMDMVEASIFYKSEKMSSQTFFCRFYSALDIRNPKMKCSDVRDVRDQDGGE